jgi:hypothetical protein
MTKSSTKRELSCDLFESEHLTQKLTCEEVFSGEQTNFSKNPL